MGFTTGFTGGVTLTLGVAYLTVLANQRHRQQQSDAIRANTGVLLALSVSDPVGAARLAADAAAAAEPVSFAPSPYLSRSAIAAHEPRPRFADQLKDRWNSEVYRAVHWAQTKDWVQAREDAEAAAAQLWARARGSSSAEAARDAVVEAAAAAKTETASARSSFASASSQAVSQAVSAVQTRAKEAVTSAANAVERGAKITGDALALQTAKTEAAAAAKASGGDADVKLALQQRYAHDDAVMKKSVSNLLEERYRQKN